MKNIYSALIVFSLFFLSSCFYDNKEDLFQIDPDCDTSIIGYSGIIKPIIDNRCYACHATGIELGNVDLEDFTSLKTYVDNETLLKSIKHEAGISPMPQGAEKMPDCEISKIEKWITNGALND